MAKALHSPEQKQRLCVEARRMMKEQVAFSRICDVLQVKPVTLRKWLNNQTRDQIYPPVPNVGRI